MKRASMISVVTLLAASVLYAAPPELTLPKEVQAEPGAFVVVEAKTEGKVVEFVPLDNGLSVLPSSLLENKKVFVAIAPKAGQYRVLAYTAVGDEPSKPTYCTIIVGGSTTPPTPPGQPPVSPPETTGLYFLIVKPDGPTHPSITQSLRLEEWQLLIKKGHLVKDKTATEAAKLGIRPTTLPAVVILQVSQDGKSSKILKTVSFPTTATDVLKLPEMVK